MALKKHKEDSFGNGGYEYWKIIGTNINWLNKTSHVSLAGYYNQQARVDNKNPMEVMSFDWSGDNFPFDIETLNRENVNVIHVAYEKIKESRLVEEVETNWFADALDC